MLQSIVGSRAWTRRRIDCGSEVHSNNRNCTTINIQQWISEESKDVGEDWSDEERRLFIASTTFYSKNFRAVKRLLPWRSMKDLVLFYYLKKKSMLKQVQNGRKEAIMTVKSLMSEMNMCRDRGNRLSLLGIDQMGHMVKPNGGPLRYLGNRLKVDNELVDMSKILSLRRHLSNKIGNAPKRNWSAWGIRLAIRGDL